MRQVRNFSEELLHKLDGLLYHLHSNNIAYSAHWVKPSPHEMRDIQNRMEKEGKKLNPSELAVMKVVWFDD